MRRFQPRSKAYLALYKECKVQNQRMILDSRNADALRRMMINGSSIKGRLEAFTAFTLPGTMEVLASVVHGNHAEALRQEVERHTRNNHQSRRCALAHRSAGRLRR